MCEWKQRGEGGVRERDIRAQKRRRERERMFWATKEKEDFQKRRWRNRGRADDKRRRENALWTVNVFPGSQ